MDEVTNTPAENKSKPGQAEAANTGYTADEIETRLVKSREIIEVSFKLIGGIGAVAYGIGFLIESIYYGRFGYISIDPISSSYLFIGMLYMFFYLVSGLPAIYRAFIGYKTDSSPKEKANRNTGCFAMGIATIVFSTCAYGIFTGTSGGSFNMDDLKSMGLFWFLNVLSLSFMLGWFTNNGFQPPKATSSYSENMVIRIFGSIISLLSIMISMAIFATQVFSQIPKAYGGGKLYEIKVCLKKTDVPLGFENIIATSKDTTGPVQLHNLYLIKETSSDYYLLPQNNPKVIILPKSIVQSAVIDLNLMQSAN